MIDYCCCPTCSHACCGSSHLIIKYMFINFLYKEEYYLENLVLSLIFPFLKSIKCEIFFTSWSGSGCKQVGLTLIADTPPLALLCTWGMISHQTQKKNYSVINPLSEFNSYLVRGTDVGVQISSFTLRHLLRGKLRQDFLGTWWAGLSTIISF